MVEAASWPQEAFLSFNDRLAFRKREYISERETARGGGIRETQTARERVRDKIGKGFLKDTCRTYT